MTVKQKGYFMTGIEEHHNIKPPVHCLLTTFNGETDWETGCGNCIELPDFESLADSNYIYCPFCAKKIKEQNFMQGVYK